VEVRKVEIDFSDAAVHWNPDQPEWAHIWNAMSTAVPALEQNLIEVVRAMRDQLGDAASPALRKDADMFMAQEGRHFRMHMKWNQKLVKAGYGEDFEAAEKKLRADYDKFLNVKGLKFNMVYCEGFETFGPVLANLFFDRSADMMKDWHEPSCHLWRWHIAEEYEHRTVCNYLYKERWGGYWMRIYGLWYASFHLFAYALSVAYRMTRRDLRTGAITGSVRSHLRYANAVWRIVKGVFPDVIRNAHRPGYDPALLPPPPMVMELMEESSKKFGVIAA